MASSKMEGSHSRGAPRCLMRREEKREEEKRREEELHARERSKHSVHANDGHRELCYHRGACDGEEERAGEKRLNCCNKCLRTKSRDREREEEVEVEKKS